MKRQTERKLAYSDDPELWKAYITGKWPDDMDFMETWAAAHAIAARNNPPTSGNRAQTGERLGTEGDEN